MVTSSRSRGQLILIGAIGVALLVIGIAVVVNAVLFTENVRPSQTTSQLDEAREIDHELRGSVRSLTLRVNHQSRDHDASDLASWTSENVSNLGQLLAESYVSSRPLLVNVSYNDGSSAFGSRLVQTGDGWFNDTGSGNQSTWQPASGEEIGWALVNVNTSGTTADPFTVTLRNGSGAAVDVEFNKTGPRGQFEIISDPPGGSPITVSCNPQGDRALLDLVRGESYTDDSCVFNGSNEVIDANEAEFDGADNAYGKYAFVAEDASGFPGSVSACAPGVPSDEPCYTPAIWTANVTTTMTGDAFTYTNRYNVSIYRGGN